MSLTPSQVSGATFRTARKGYDQVEVDSFLNAVAKALEEAQQHATTMEARARAAVARAQELSVAAEQADAVARAQPPAAESAAGPATVRVTADDAETITRTLLLAQHAADTTRADAESEAERILREAKADSEATLDSTRELSAKLLDEARSEARKASEAERLAGEDEVQSLVARREFLTGDVTQLEQFLDEQRERLRAAARQIEALCDRVPAGLGHAHSPALSASDDDPSDITAEHFRPPTSDMTPVELEITEAFEIHRLSDD
jgi:DivIVA domain-containing protein